MGLFSFNQLSAEWLQGKALRQFQAGQYENSEETMIKAIDAYLDAGNKIAASYAMANLVQIYLQQDKLKDAEDALKIEVETREGLKFGGIHRHLDSDKKSTAYLAAALELLLDVSKKLNRSFADVAKIERKLKELKKKNKWLFKEDSVPTVGETDSSPSKVEEPNITTTSHNIFNVAPTLKQQENNQQTSINNLVPSAQTKIVEIVNEGMIYQTINETNCIVWPSTESKAL